MTPAEAPRWRQSSTAPRGACGGLSDAGPITTLERPRTLCATPARCVGLCPAGRRAEPPADPWNQTSRFAHAYAQLNAARLLGQKRLESQAACMRCALGGDNTGAGAVRCQERSAQRWRGSRVVEPGASEGLLLRHAVQQLADAAPEAGIETRLGMQVETCATPGLRTLSVTRGARRIARGMRTSL